MVADFVPVTVLAEADGRSAIQPLTELAAGDAIVLVGADNAFPGATLVPRERATGGPPAGAGAPGPAGEAASGEGGGAEQ
jgi:hypothetical protein